MSAVAVILMFCLIGILGARQPDIDFNRIRLLSKERTYPSNYPHIRRSIVNSNHIDKYHRNDYDDHSSGLSELRAQAPILYDPASPAEAKAVKIHQPREDPRLFYQSDSYLQEINRKNMSPEMSAIYPGMEVVRASELNEKPSSPVRLRYRIANSINEENICVKCPHDITLIAKTGVDKVLLQHPRLFSCSGRKAPRGAHFEHMYGPNFNALLKEGSHVMIGRIVFKGKALQTCKMQIHVLMQTCPVPDYLVAHCDAQNKKCKFRCRDSKSELHGRTSVICGNHMKWNGTLPICRARTGCEPPPPPQQGRVSCKGPTSERSELLVEGSSCRVRCAQGWRSHSRLAAVCRRGTWTQELMCYPKRIIKPSD